MKPDYVGNIRKFQTANFTVSIDAYYDYDVDLSFDDSGDVLRKLEHGDLIAFTVHTTVTHNPSGLELGADYIGGYIYKSIDEFQDHRECGAQSRRQIRREGKFQVYRKNRKYEHCLTRADKLRKRGFATRQKAESWAAVNATEPFEIFETGKCGSYFADMVSGAITEARKRLAQIKATA